MKRWTEAEMQVLREEYFKRPINVIAEMLNRSKPSVYIKAQDLGLIKRPRKAKEETVPAVELREPVAEG